jgi:hypothetical protein
MRAVRSGRARQNGHERALKDETGEFVTRFSDLTEYVAIPAVTSVRLSPDGSWLAAEVHTIGLEPSKFGTSIWRIDTSGGPPVRLTRSAEGESARSRT